MPLQVVGGTKGTVALAAAVVSRAEVEAMVAGHVGPLRAQLTRHEAAVRQVSANRAPTAVATSPWSNTANPALALALNYT